MQQGHHSLCSTFRCSPSSKGHDKGRFISHPREFNRSEGFDLFNGPRSVASMKGNSKGFRQRFKRRVQPTPFVPAQMARKGREGGALGVDPSLFSSVRWSSHRLGSDNLAFGLPP